MLHVSTKQPAFKNGFCHLQSLQRVLFRIVIKIPPPPKKTNPLKFSFPFYNFICIEHSTSNMKIKNQINKALAIIV